MQGNVESTKERRSYIGACYRWAIIGHYEEGYDKICEKIPQLPSASQLDPYPPTKLT